MLAFFFVALMSCIVTLLFAWEPVLLEVEFALSSSLTSLLESD